MSDSTPFTFSFGAGANQPAMVYEPNPGPRWVSPYEKEVMDLKAKVDILEVQLDAALVQVQAAKQNPTEAQSAITRLQATRQHDINTIDELKQARMDDYNHIIKLQGEAAELKSTIKYQRDELTRANELFNNGTRQLEELNSELDSHKQRADELRASIEHHKGETEHQKALAAELERHLQDTYADLENTKRDGLAAIKAKDDLEALCHNADLRFQDLHRQWQDAQGQVQQLQSTLDQLPQVDLMIRNLESDVERLQATSAEHDRTILVKDERILHLEKLYQKERERNLHAADAAADAAAASPVDEAPPSFASLGDTLQDELNAASDEYGDFHYEHVEHCELSDITAVADYAPIAPVSRPFTIDVIEAASASPITVAVPTLSIDISHAGSVTPIERQVNTTSASVQTEPQALAFELLHDATIDISPIAPNEIAHATTSTQTEAPKLTAGIVGSSSIAVSPVDVPASQPTSHMVDSASMTIAPVEAQAQKLTLSIIDSATASTSPIEPQAQTLTSRIVDSATTSTSPTEAQAQKLTLSIIDSATTSTSPVEPQAQTLTSRLIDSATLSTSPIEAQHNPTAPSDANITLGDINVILEQQPVDARPPKTSTASTAAQTTATATAPIDARPPKTSTTSTAAQTTATATTPTVPVVATPKRNGISLAQAILPFLCFLLTITCLHLYIKLDSWRYANGVGYTYSNAGRTGAFGSGHNLFGFIPIATDMDAPWWEVQLSMWLSVVSKGFEDWAGIDTRSLY